MSAVTSSASVGQPVSFVRRLLTRPLAVLALAWLFLLLVLAVGAPVLVPLDPLDQDLLAIKQWPSAEHWLGTDALGRDVFSRTVYGIGVTLTGVLEAVLISALLSIGLGVSAGYFGGRWDRWVQQYVSLVQSLPTMLILLAVLSLFGQDILPAMVTLGIMGSAGVSRVLRLSLIHI